MGVQYGAEEGIHLISEWLLFNANSANFQLYYGENKLIFNEMIMRSALFQIETPSMIFIVLVHWNNILWIDIPIQSLFLLLNAACLAEMQQIPVL